ncbi:MAG: hypothetical protein HFG00_11260 [Oscillibacter sp.]|nr:hypothetical protein [Oscillibacter sp.]
MMPISDVNTSAVQPLTAAGKVLGAPKVQKPEEESQGRPLKPVMDEYIPEEPQEPSGRYWMGKDEDGQPKIYFDDPERAAEEPKQPEDAPDAGKPDADAPEEPDPAGQGAKGPEGKEDKDETWECNTDQVDREIEKLKKKQQELEQRLHTETDEAKIQDLEQQLSQVEQELRQKDNDMYRRQHASVRRLS